MQKDDEVYLGHMLDIARKARQFVEKNDRTAFDTDEPLRIALAHLLQVIGEAARHVSRDFQDSHPQIPWNLIIGMRHKVVHDYMNVDEDVVWRTITLDLPPLIAVLESLRPPEGNA
jgi:uncharacterized protein with HEPN domain